MLGIVSKACALAMYSSSTVLAITKIEFCLSKRAKTALITSTAAGCNNIATKLQQYCYHNLCVPDALTLDGVMR